VLPAGCNTDGISIYENSVYPFPLTNIDPYVTVSNITYVSATETDFTVTIAADAPTEYDAVRIICLSACGIFNEVRLGAYIQPPAPPPPPPCPIPAITAVTPDIWFAGKTYNKVTITGSGFTDTESCPAPQINMYDVDGNQIPFSDAKVTSATEMIAHKVAPPSDTDTETVCVSEGTRVGPQVVSRFASTGASAALASDTAGSPCTDPYGNQGITVQILAAPKILWNDKRISVIDDGSGTEPTPQNAVVGQQIKLKTKPTADKLTTLGLAFSKNKWTVGGTRIADYAPTVASAKVKELTDADLKKANITFYWIYRENDNIPVTYKYCVDIPGADADGQCSLPANAAFNVAGPTSVTVTPSGQEFFIGDNPPAMNWGIQFNANATPPSGYTGTLTWIQLVQSFQYTWIYSDGDQPTTCTYTPGFDAGSPPSYPYATGAYAEDGPLIGLESPPNNDEIEQTASGQYQMYLMWNPSIGSGTSVSIPVPLGSLTWNIAGDVVWSAGTGAWVEVTADSNATTNGNFTTSSAYPTWQLPATPCQ